MASTRPHTREFSDDARNRLGLAVTRAREAAGYPTRPSFLQSTHGFGKRSLASLENGEPVGPRVYEAVARFLPGWDEGTPCTILKDGDIPPTKVEALEQRYPNDPERREIWKQVGDAYGDDERAAIVEALYQKRHGGGQSETGTWPI